MSQLVSIDPGSLSAGVAVFDAGGRVVEMDRYVSHAKDPFQRLDVMLRAFLVDLIRWHPARVVMEGQPRKHRRTRERATKLATYGVAVGAWWRECVWALANMHDDEGSYRVTVVSANDWCGGVKKEDRGRVLAMTCQEYRDWATEKPGSSVGRADPKLDVADAVGLGLWELGRWQRKALEARMRDV